MNSDEFRQWCQLVDDVAQPPLLLRKPLIMGVLNVTPNSFSDGGNYLNPNSACQRALEMINQGVDIIDLGGESSKPGAIPVSCDEELARVIPVIEMLRQLSDVCISIDTCKADVMQAAVAVGASMINDINALRGEVALATAAKLQVPVCLMHMQDTPLTMQNNPHYQGDVVDEINDFFRQRIDACLDAGISRKHLILDPGFGFGKSVRNNLQLLKRLDAFQKHHLPILLGVSRKSTIGAVLGKEVGERLSGGIAIAVLAALKKVSIIRTHDVDETNQAVRMIEAIDAADRYNPCEGKG